MAYNPNVIHEYRDIKSLFLSCVSFPSEYSQPLSSRALPIDVKGVDKVEPLLEVVYYSRLSF